MARTPRFNMTLSPRQRERLDAYCKDKGRNLSNVIRDALDQYLSPWENTQNEVELAKQMLANRSA